MRIPRRKEIIDKIRQDNGRIAAVLPIHYPRELLRAYGIHPMEVWGPPAIRASAGNSHFQSYTCSIVRNATSFLIEGGLHDAGLLLIPHTCDALQGMASVLRDFIHPKQPVFTLYLPRGNRDVDVDFLTQEIRQLSRALQEFTGITVSDEQLTEAITEEEEADLTVARLYQRRPELRLSDREFFTLIRSREYLPLDDFLHLTRELPVGEGERPGVPLIVSGIVPDDMRIFDLLNQMGAQIVGDDLACCGRRLYPAVTEPDPYRRMARRLLGAPPDPTRGSPLGERAEFLIRKVRQTGAKGILFYEIKFCEPELFDIPLLRQRLNGAGIPTLHVEVDLEGAPSQQILTRIEAFVEML